jgi:biotin transporter BioY
VERRRFLVALGLVVVYFVGWVALGLVTGVADNGGGPHYVDTEPTGITWGPFLIYGALLGAFLALAVYAGWRLFAQRGRKFEDLDGDEQARRREAGKLLHDL